MKALLFLVMISMAIPVFAGATSNEKGNGGCAECQISYELGMKIAAKLITLGNEKVKKKVPLIQDVSELYRLAETRRVEPGTRGELEGRDAMSFPDTRQTLINKKAYRGLPQFKRYRLELHELLVLAKVESEGVYIWSSKLSELFRLETETEGFSCNNGVCAIHYPRPVFEGRQAFVHEKSSMQGVCEFYHLGAFIGAEFRHRTYFAEAQFDDTPRMKRTIEIPENAFLITQEGNILREIRVPTRYYGYYQDVKLPDFKVIESIQCRERD